MSKTVRTSSISPPPGQEDQSARLAASAEVGQVEGTTLTINFDSRDGLVAPFFTSSFAFFGGNSREWLQTLIDFSPHLARRSFCAVASLPTHAVRAVGRSYVDGCTSFARLVAVCVSATVDGLSVRTGSGADEYGQQRFLQHCGVSFPMLGSFA